MQNINIQKFNIEIVKMDKSMLSSVQQIAAYATTKFIDLDYLKKIIKNHKLQLDKNNIKIGYIDSITVDINYSGHGIGTLLLKETISRLKESNTTFSIMAGWKNKDQVNIRNLATKESFKEEFTIENFWKDDSIEFNFDCTACGSPPCLCSAIIYTKFLNKY